jgi:hypothetical protein
VHFDARGAVAHHVEPSAAAYDKSISRLSTNGRDH